MFLIMIIFNSTIVFFLCHKICFLWKSSRISVSHVQYLFIDNGQDETMGDTVFLHQFLCLKIEVWYFFCEYSSYWCASTLLIICPSGYKGHKCIYIYIETSISRVLLTIEDWYFLWWFIWWMSIYYMNILSVCLSVRLKKKQM